MANPLAGDGALIPATSTLPHSTAINAGIDTGQPGVRQSIRMVSLPNELLHHVASYLKPSDLYNLSLLSKHVATIAQEQLHAFPKLRTVRGLRRQSRIALLARTLSDRPNLAQKVHRLVLRPSACMVDWETHKYVSSYMYHGQKMSTLFKRETLFAGDILQCIRHVSYLKRQILGQGECIYDPSFHSVADAIFGHLFGQRFQYSANGEPCLSLIPGLEDLECLTLGGSAIHGAWRNLPRLKQLVVTGDSELIDLPVSPQATGIENMIIEKNTYVLASYEPLDQSIGGFFAGQSSLESLDVVLCNFEGDGQSWGHLIFPNDGNFDRLIWNFGPVASTPDELVITKCDEKHHGHTVHTSFLNFVTPITSLAHFKQLRVLELPHEALIPQQRSLDNLFPASLEVLKVHAPCVSIYWLFQQMGLDRTNLPSFNTIELFTYKARGDSLEEFAFRLNPIWTLLRSNEISVRFHWDQAEYRQDWWDREYDPFVCEIVEALDTLKVEQNSAAVIQYMTDMSM